MISPPNYNYNKNNNKQQTLIFNYYRYRLDNTIGSKFTIEPVTGEILTAGPLNREEQSSYDIIVTVEDGDLWTSQTTVTVYLDDINDNAPQFSEQGYQALIPSNTTAGECLLFV